MWQKSQWTVHNFTTWTICSSYNLHYCIRILSNSWMYRNLQVPHMALDTTGHPIWALHVHKARTRCFISIPGYNAATDPFGIFPWITPTPEPPSGISLFILIILNPSISYIISKLLSCKRFSVPGAAGLNLSWNAPNNLSKVSSMTLSSKILSLDAFSTYLVDLKVEIKMFLSMTKFKINITYI